MISVAFKLNFTLEYQCTISNSISDYVVAPAHLFLNTIVPATSGKSFGRFCDNVRDPTRFLYCLFVTDAFHCDHELLQTNS